MDFSAESTAAVVEFRESVDTLKEAASKLSCDESLLNQTEAVYSKCDDALKFIFKQNEEASQTIDNLQSKLTDLQRIHSDLNMYGDVLEILSHAESCMRALEKIESHYAEKDFYQLVVNVESLSTELDQCVWKDTKLFEAVNFQLKKWKSVSNKWLGACLDQCILLTGSMESGKISCSVDEQYLKNLCKEASYDLLLNVFTLFSSQLLANFIVPILRRSVSTINTEKSVLVITLPDEEITDADGINSRNEKMILSMIPTITNVFKFLKEHVFIHLKNRKFYFQLVEAFGSQIIEDMSSLMCSLFLRPLLPKCPSQLGSFDIVISEVKELQLFWKDSGFASTSSKQLGEFIHDYVNIVLEKYETNLLFQARDYLIGNWLDLVDCPTYVIDQVPAADCSTLPSRMKSDDINNSIFGSSKKNFFHLPPCKISNVVAEHVNLIRNVLDEVKSLIKASESSEKSLAEVLHFMAPCVRHVADMFLAFLPVMGDKGTIQSASLVLCNCSYFVSSLLNLEIEFSALKQSLPSRFKGSLPLYLFIDIIQPARSHGWDTFQRALEKERKQIVDVDLDPWVQGADGKVMASGFRGQCEQSLLTVIAKLSSVYASLKSALPPSLASASLGYLIDAVLSKVVKSLAKRVDISDSESRVHFEMLNTFSDNMIENIGSEVCESTSVMAKVTMARLCPESWSRFMDMISLLDSDLASIVDRWADGAGPLANSFAADELRTIIRALFQNSEVRQRALNSIH